MSESEASVYFSAPLFTVFRFPMQICSVCHDCKEEAEKESWLLLLIASNTWEEVEETEIDIEK